MSPGRIEEFCVQRDQCALVVSSLGATITSWKVDGDEMLFLSANSCVAEGLINGGMPLVFPHFGEWGDKPLHGFARSSIWTLDDEPRKRPVLPHSLRFHLKDNAETRAIWNHSFHLIYDLQLLESNKLRTSLHILNTGPTAFDFHLLFHPYFKVDAGKVTVTGLEGLDYIDKTDNFVTKTETRKLVSIDKFHDNVYHGTPSDHVLNDGQKTIKIWKSDTLPNTVVWNPHNLDLDRFGLAKDEDKEYICVEPGKVTDKVTLEPGTVWDCAIELTAGKA